MRPPSCKLDERHYKQLHGALHVRVLPLDLAQATEFVLLGVLSDPFDRMTVAAARGAGHPLLTADASIAESGLVEVIWD